MKAGVFLFHYVLKKVFCFAIQSFHNNGYLKQFFFFCAIVRFSSVSHNNFHLRLVLFEGRKSSQSPTSFDKCRVETNNVRYSVRDVFTVRCVEIDPEKKTLAFREYLTTALFLRELHGEPRVTFSFLGIETERKPLPTVQDNKIDTPSAKFLEVLLNGKPRWTS